MRGPDAARATYDRVAGLELTIDGYALEALTRDVSSDFTRISTVIQLRGAGEEGLGEDVTYETPDHEALAEFGPSLPLAGDWTIDSFSRQLESLELFPRAPARAASRDYRRWAFESAALDLALRQAGRPLHEVLERPCRPLTYVVSLRLGEPPSLEPVLSRLERYPDLRFKLDATSSWDDKLIASLVDTGVVDSIDLKGLYEGSVVDQGADAELYRRVAEAFPDAWIEDPKLTPETEAVLADHHDRITWDAAIHSVADIDALPFAPKMVNVKPSRFGPLSELFAAYDACETRGIRAYGGGQFELGPGRGQIQYLAAMLHPETPNDVSPVGFHEPHPAAGLDTSPLEPRPAATGFRWGE